MTDEKYFISLARNAAVIYMINTNYIITRVDWPADDDNDDDAIFIRMKWCI